MANDLESTQPSCVASLVWMYAWVVGRGLRKLDHGFVLVHGGRRCCLVRRWSGEVVDAVVLG